jgi:hypothetical protein
MVVARCINSEEEIAAANYPEIRHIKVPKLTASVPAKDFPGEWQVCSPATAGVGEALSDSPLTPNPSPVERERGASETASSWKADPRADLGIGNGTPL